MSIFNPFSTTVTETDMQDLKRGGLRTVARLVIVEQDVDIPHSEMNLVDWFNRIADLTKRGADADYQYGGHGGLILNLPDVSINKLRDDVIWALAQGCKRFGYQPHLSLPFGMPELKYPAGRHVNIAVLNRDFYGHDKRSPQERLSQHLELYYGLNTRRPTFPLLTQLSSGTGYVAYGGHGEMIKEIVVVTAAGTRAFRLDIVDEEALAMVE
jgi:hypothetical protein